MPKYQVGKTKTGGRSAGTKNKHHSCLETIQSAIEHVTYEKLLSELADPRHIKTVNRLVAGFIESANKNRVEFNDLHNLETK